MNFMLLSQASNIQDLGKLLDVLAASCRDIPGMVESWCNFETFQKITSKPDSKGISWARFTIELHTCIEARVSLYCPILHDRILSALHSTDPDCWISLIARLAVKEEQET
jgi:hypothetical protein